MYEHVVASGCSFTQRDESWSNRLKDFFPDKKVYNASIGGSGNYVISTLCINQVQSLLDSGIKPDEIFVFVQWTGIFRKSFIVDGSSPPSSIDWNQCNSSLELKNLEGGSKLCWDAGKRNNIPFWSRFYEDYWTDECAFVETLENILRTQWFLKSNNVKFLMFCGWDIFTKCPEYVPSSYLGKMNYEDSHNNPHQWDDVIYYNFNYDLLKDKHKWSTHLWDMIDFERFLFFENDKIKYGGLLQWVQHNLSDPSTWYISKGDHHPSYEGQQKFFKSFIKPRFEKEILEQL